MTYLDLTENYNKLISKYKELAILASTDAIIKWDMETKMPPGAFHLRGEQLAQLSQISHRMATAPETGAILDRVEKHPDYGSLSDLQRRNVYLIRKDYDEKTKLPDELVSEIAKQQAAAYESWKRAKASKNFNAFKAELTKMFELKKRESEILMTVKGTKTPYDAAMDLFEPKMTGETIARTFEELKRGLLPIIEKYAASQLMPAQSFLRWRIPSELQIDISKSIARFMNYDTESASACGRIDETEHPFTTGYYDDVRITTHYSEDNFSSSLFSVLHEGGHAMYEQNLKKEWMYQPIGTACSYGFHESQSRFVENIVGRSREFWSYFLPELKNITGSTFGDIDLEQFVHAVNVIRPSKIRTEADEATYSMHIIIRFEIEQDLFAGKIAIEEFPQVWNQKYMDYLGLRIDDDSEGVMQDVHWAQGYFGYFPSYALGNIYGGQILHRLESEIVGWRDLISNGSFCNIREWLVTNVHSYGNLYDPLPLLNKITGEGINPGHFVEYLRSKYSELYD